MRGHNNPQSKSPQGKPSGDQRGGNGLKDLGHEHRENQKLEDQYFDEDGKPEANVNLRHENRNTDKGREDQGKDDSGW
jgi:hypothetical protein